MNPLASLSEADARGVRVVCADIDDTLTTHGKLTAAAYDALWRLHDRGLCVVPITGRPAGWCDLISRQWPVDAVIGENGAFAFTTDASGHQQITYNHSAPEPNANRSRLQAIADEVYREIPGTRAAKDQLSRLFDVAIDFREEEPFLGLDVAERIRARFESRGAHAKVSSIHVNAWFGDYDKLSMTRQYLRDVLQIDLEQQAENRQVIFVGDSPNDEPMFAAFGLSVGVANVRQFIQSMDHQPAYVTRAESGHGFVELADLLLEFRV